MKQNIAQTRTVVDSRNPFYAYYYQQAFKSMVPVPAAVVSTIFQLDFKRMLEMYDPKMQKTSEAKLEQLLRILISTYDSLKTDDVVKQLKNMGLQLSANSKDPDSDDATLKDFVEQLRRKITSSVAESGIQNLMIRNVLSERLQSNAIDAFDKVDMKYIATAVRTTQKFWSRFANATPGPELVQFLSEEMAANPLLAGLKSLSVVLRSDQAAVIPCRESYAIDQLFQIAFGQPFISQETILQAKAYNVTGMVMPEITFADSVACFMWSMNQIMGLGDPDPEVKQMPLSKMVDQVVTGVGQNMPFLPSEAGLIDAKRMDQHFTKTYMLNAFMRMLRDQPGDLRNRVANQVKNSKFFKIDEYETQFNESLYIMSVAFEAFRDTAAFYRELYKREDILFADYNELHPLKRRQVTKFLEDTAMDVSGFLLNMEHPNYYKQAGHLISHSSTYLSGEAMHFDYVLSKKEKQAAPPYVLVTSGSVEQERFLRVFSSGVVSGSWYDLNDGGLPLSIRMIMNARIVKPSYKFTMEISNPLLTTKVVQHLYSLFPLDAILKIQKQYPEIGDALTSVGQLVQYASAEELSIAMQIPLELASLIWEKKGGSEFFLDVSGHTGIMYFIDPALCPMYETRELSTDRYVTPFISNYPALDIEENSAFQITSTPAIFVKPLSTEDKGGKGKKKGEKPAAKPETEESDDEGTENSGSEEAPETPPAV